jgi:hypothetical protein
VSDSQSLATTVEVNYEAADLRQLVLAERQWRPPSKILGLALLIGFAWLVAGIIDAAAVADGDYGATILLTGGAMLSIAAMFVVGRRQTRARQQDLIAGPPVEITVGDSLSYRCGGETVSLSWRAVELYRTPHAIVLRGPHSHTIVIPARASASREAHRALAAEIEMRIDSVA